MSADRLPTEFWVAAQLRRFSAAGTGAYLMRRGDTERGAVLVRLAGPEGVRVLTQVRDLEGRLAWMAAKEGASMSSADADSYVERAVSRDSDLWVIEIETRSGETPFEGRVVGL
jgi:hypothetical protein